MRLGHLQTEGNDLDRDRRYRPQMVHQLDAVDDNGELAAGGSDDLLPQQGAAEALHEVERAALDLIGTVDGEVDLAMLGEAGQRDPCPLGLGPGTLGSRDAEESQTLAMAHRQGLDGEGRGRAGT